MDSAVTRSPNPPFGLPGLLSSSATLQPYHSATSLRDFCAAAHLCARCVLSVCRCSCFCSCFCLSLAILNRRSHLTFHEPHLSQYESQFEENLYNLRREKLAQIAAIARAQNSALT